MAVAGGAEPVEPWLGPSEPREDMGDGDAWGPDHLQRMGLHLRPAGTRGPHLAVPRAEQTDPGGECGPKTC